MMPCCLLTIMAGRPPYPDGAAPPGFRKMLFVKKASYLHFDRYKRNERWLNSVLSLSLRDVEMRSFRSHFELRH